MEEGFRYASASGVKVACITCGATGYPGGSWQESHRAGHPFPCGQCSKVFSTGQGASAHERNVHRADRFDLYERRAVGVRAYWERRRAARGLAS